MRDGFLDGDEQFQARIAWLYYNQEMTQADIAQHLGINRSRVNQVLRIARNNGLVQVIIHSRLASCVALERQLEKNYGLRRCVIVPTPDREERLFAALGGAAGLHVSQNLRSRQTLGLGWGRTMDAAVGSLTANGLADMRVVTLFGGLARSAVGNPEEVAVKAANRLNNAELWRIPAPMYVDTPELRDMLARQDVFRSLFAKVGLAEMALIGVGDLTLRSSNLLSGAVSEQDWTSLLQAGAVGEIFGRFLDESGNVIAHPLNNRFTGPNYSSLRRIRHVVLVAGGRQKIPILRAALSKGYAHALVSDERTATQLIAQNPQPAYAASQALKRERAE